ncbi:zinc finger CCCH-type with G patch domain-containing protein [Anopheles darlingi]|uniref:zinc finger CCCH-type with G patch domain-containing protein n=1 Tax=Anopheles darlingi TaxID=43151 RepID=UPI0021000A47|nr:zinc finger CCCH-type with G patch domain-containing protein [Anopheles darlingi]XP_049531321.1 zinc finger CCCH-type with G patch domain-containing protein [Anopheles darlingi]
MSSAKELNESILQYQTQLTQINQALQLTTDAGERTELEKLKDDLTELLTLTQETLDHSTAGEEPKAGDKIDDEFALFMSEIKQLDSESKNDDEAVLKTEEPDNEPVTKPEPEPEDELDLDGLIGSKCSAPHVHTWGSKVYHNAMVCSLDTSELAEATAKVLFTNPTHREMVPCAYFLEGECRFTDDRCHYSHGETVRLDELRDYREPKFEQLQRPGSRALVKQTKTRLWCKGTVRSVDYEHRTCKLVLEEGKREVEGIPFEDLLPLDDELEDEDDEDDDDDDDDDDADAIRKAQLVEKSLFQPAPDRRLGEWEDHTRGIGSKIMQKMGYVVGTGLGREGEGIVLPVSAQVLPQGRSLDYCMELREQANGDRDLFSVEKKLVQLRKQQEKRDARDYARQQEAAAKRKDVFSFINDEVLSAGGQSSKRAAAQHRSPLALGSRDLKEHSSKNLNIASLKLSEEIRRVEAEVERLKIALTRHKPGTPAGDSLQRQLAAKRADIARLQATEGTISKEQQLRNDKRKMTVF